MLEQLLQQRITQQKTTPQKYRPDVFPFFEPTRDKLKQLPAKIRQGKYRVINAAVPGYTSGNSLGRFALEIFPYQPDLIIVLDGYDDIMLSSSQSQADIPKIDDFLADATGHFQVYWSHAFEEWLGQTAISQIVEQWQGKTPSDLTQNTLVTATDNQRLEAYLPSEPQELEKRIRRYRENHQKLIRLAATAQVPVMMVTQPEITGRPIEQLSSNEKIIRDRLGVRYIEQTTKAYQKLNQTNQLLAQTFPQNVKFLNLYNLQSKPGETLLIDPIHLNQKSNEIVASKIYSTLTAWERFQIIPQNYYLKNR